MIGHQIASLRLRLTVARQTGAKLDRPSGCAAPDGRKVRKSVMPCSRDAAEATAWRKRPGPPGELSKTNDRISPDAPSRVHGPIGKPGDLAPEIAGNDLCRRGAAPRRGASVGL